MSVEQIGATSCLLSALLIAIVRIPSVTRNRRGRPSWYALLVGVAAFTAKGSSIPLQLLDGALGGENYVNLAQNALAVVAFWILFRAVTSLEREEFSWGSPVIVIGAVLSFAVPFIYVPGRHGTSTDFIDEFAPHWELCLYASIYMVWVTAFAIATIRAARDRSARMYVPIRIGCASVAIASIAEVVYLVSRASGLPREGVVEFLKQMFQPLFYGGVGLISLGMAGFWASRAARRIAEAAMNWATSRPSSIQVLPTALALPADQSDATMNTFRLAVSILDSRGEKPEGVRGIVFRIVSSRLFDKQINTPTIEGMVYLPRGSS